MSRLDDLFQEACLQLSVLQEAEVKRLLGEWVSELEPVLVYDEQSRVLLGLGMAGVPIGQPAAVYVHARPIHVAVRT